MDDTARRRFGALLLALGASVLLFRTLRLVFVEDALILLAGWVIFLLFLEMAVDAACLLTAFRWAVSARADHALLPLRLGAAAALLHAFRVLIYVLGSTGPWVDFDRKPAYRGALPAEWIWVVFAAVLSVLGIIGVVIIRHLRRRSRRSSDPG